MSRFVALCSLLAASGCGSEGTVGSSRWPIIGGTADTGDPAVVMLFVQNQTQEASCTGVIVSPHVVVTAAHCVAPSVIDEVVTPPYDFFVYLGDDINSPDQGYDPKNFAHVKTTAFDPLFALAPGDATPPTHDVGIAVTREALKQAPLPLNRSVLGQAWVGQPVRIVGYGWSVAGDKSTRERKRQASTTIAGIDDEDLWIEDPDASICEGDSGGPTLITRNGIESIAGLHSWGEHGMSCTGKSYDVRVDVDVVRFVDPLIAANDPGFQPPSSGPDDAGTGGQDAGSQGGEDGGGQAGDSSGSSGCSLRGVSGSPPTGALAALALTLVFTGRAARRRKQRAAETGSPPRGGRRPGSDSKDRVL